MLNASSKFIALSEVHLRFPQLVEKFGWTEKVLKTHLHDGLLIGFQESKKEYIELESLVDLIRYKNRIIEKQKVRIRRKFNK